jgi:hypothetical protein
VDVRRRETQEPISGVDEQVLAPIVLHHALPMVTAVVLENKAGIRVEEVGSADEPRCIIAEIRLDLRPGQAGLHQEPTKSSFHWRLSRSRQLRQRPHPCSAGSTFSRFGVLTQNGRVGKIKTDRHIDGD